MPTKKTKTPAKPAAKPPLPVSAKRTPEKVRTRTAKDLGVDVKKPKAKSAVPKPTPPAKKNPPAEPELVVFGKPISFKKRDSLRGPDGKFRFRASVPFAVLMNEAAQSPKSYLATKIQDLMNWPSVSYPELVSVTPVAADPKKKTVTLELVVECMSQPTPVANLAAAPPAPPPPPGEPEDDDTKLAATGKLGDELPEALPPPTVSATITSDDGKFSFEFDATTWFQTAGDDAILMLAGEGWGGGVTAEDIAHALRSRRAHVATVLAHCDKLADEPATSHLSGFTVTVDQQQAIAWVETSRPNLVQDLTKITDEQAAAFKAAAADAEASRMDEGAAEAMGS